MRLQVHCLYICFLLVVALTSLSQAAWMGSKSLEWQSEERHHHVQSHHVPLLRMQPHHIESRSPQLKPVGDLVENVLTDTGKAVGELVGGKDKETSKAPN